MTFENFKKQVEVFGKLDTAEKLANCEHQYQWHLLHIEDANYFEPIDNNMGDNIVDDYKKNLYQIFNFHNITKNQFYFLITPSFDPESLLIIEQKLDKYVLALNILTKNYWSEFYKDNRTINAEHRILKSDLKKNIGDKLFMLLDSTIIEARVPKGKGFVLDGVFYQLSKILNGKQKVVSKHSPSEDSKSGKIIKILELLTDNIEKLDDNMLSSIDTKINNLLN